MKLLLLFCACFTITLAQQISVQPHVIKGELATIGQFPWQAAIIYTLRGNKTLCGGTLINNQWILTAAHCLLNATDFQVTLGVTTLFSNETGQLKFNIPDSNTFPHPQYNPLHANNDIGLVKLPNPIEFTQNIKPLRLAQSNIRIRTLTRVVVSGWGRYNLTHNNLSMPLRHTTLLTIPNNLCNFYYAQGWVLNSNLCAYNVGITACNGDSGSPVYLIDSDGQPIHVGVVSFAHPLCRPGYPNVFARTSNFITFINKITGLNYS